ncbi:MAG: hypothetical protein LJE84_11755 [Gammaproteobacteria bacterium]|nr:hypothetical protein [Gammaproteobacteria bacterium]
MKYRTLSALVMALPLVATSAFAATATDFVFACQASLNWTKHQCECAAGKATKELTPRGVDFEVASFRGNQAEIAQLRAEMTPAEISQAATFMTHAGKACAGQ